MEYFVRLWLQGLGVHGGVSLNSVTFHVMTVCGITSGYESFERRFCLHLQGFYQKADIFLLKTLRTDDADLLF